MLQFTDEYIENKGVMKGLGKNSGLKNFGRVISRIQQFRTLLYSDKRCRKY